MKKQNITLAVLTVLGLLQKVQAFPASHDIDSSDGEESRTVWPIPQRNGSIVWMTEEEALLEAERSEQSPMNFGARKSDKVRFFLYTQQNPENSIELYPNDVDSLRNSTFNAKHPTRFMIHGWATDYDHEDLFAVKKALLLSGKKTQVNFIAVDWSVYSHTMNYISAKNKTSKAGEQVAQFIDWLHDSANLTFANLAVYGHSLGAHVAGFTGKNVKRGRVHTIVGLDPAMPLFRIKYPEKRLSATDAEYVETIQTNGGLLGFYNPIGQSAFYPNGGRHQPGCGSDLNGSCSHGRSTAYFAEALRLGPKNGLTGVRCKSFESLKSEMCLQFATRRNLGDPNNADMPNGIFYVKTNSDSPYGKNIRL